MAGGIFRALTVLLLLTMGFVAGTVFGFREGAESFASLNAVARGAQAVVGLEAQEKGNPQMTSLLLNVDVDDALYRFSLAEEKWWFPLYRQNLMGVLVAPDLELSTEFVQQVAAYRKKNPLPQDPAAFDNPSPAVQEMFGGNADPAELHRDRLRRVNRIVERYGPGGL